ncbi:hypothetical protein PQX77_001230 [Marasmius sp. AFHP31]|nr:hypothetical protein PQX77_001230 [Marasmius sp. AFHP31]
MFGMRFGRGESRFHLRQTLNDNLTWTIFTSILVFVVGSLLALVFSIDFNGPVRENDALTNASDKDGIILIGHAFDIKTGERSMRIQWTPSGCGALFNSSRSPSSTNPSNGGTKARCGRPNRKVAIYINGEMDKPAWDFDPESVPVNAGGMQSGQLSSSEWFVTDSQIDMYTWVLPTNKHTMGLDFFYPFLRYEVTHNFFAVASEDDSEPGNATQLTPIQILDAVVVTATDNYVPGLPTIHRDHTVSFSPPNASSSTPPIELPALLGRYTFALSTVAKSFSLLLFTVNWALALLVTFMTVALSVGKIKHGSQVPDSVLAMPLTIILMVPGLRALFIGDPPFGNVLDLTGFFPQMILIGVSSFVLLVLMSHDLRKQHEVIPNSRRGSKMEESDEEMAMLLKDKEDLKVMVSSG